ncbi:MAG: DUF5615 family PIN-like protein [Alphaproteobacteria bacterium]|nr:DUF5615 family PIN-like protein [Alphaproteobacteria bacterium]
MRLILDACVWGAAQVLAGHGHDVVWVGAWTADPGDEAILLAANAQGRILVTLDKDFGELAVAAQQPHVGIIRLVGLRAIEQAEACHAILQRHGEVLSQGAIVTASATRWRIRLPR